MGNKTWFQVILDEIEKRIAQLNDQLGRGCAKNFEEYRELVGQIKGLRATGVYIQDLARAYQEDEDEQ